MRLNILVLQSYTLLCYINGLHSYVTVTNFRTTKFKNFGKKLHLQQNYIAWRHDTIVNKIANKGTVEFWMEITWPPSTSFPICQNSKRFCKLQVIQTFHTRETSGRLVLTQKDCTSLPNDSCSTHFSFNPWKNRVCQAVPVHAVSVPAH